VTQHLTPSTYILRNLNDVEVLPSVSWLPETIGWKVLTALALLLLAYGSYRRCARWWRNRYRREATQALQALLFASNDENSDTAYRLFSVLKSVLYYLDNQHGRLQNEAFLTTLDAMNSGHAKQKHSDGLEGENFQFSGELGNRWMHSLVNPKARLSANEIEFLIYKSLCWVDNHQHLGGQANV